MSILDRRRFLCSAATAATIGSVTGTGVSGDRQVATQTQWEWVDSGRTYSTLTDSRHVDDGYLFVGTVRDGTDPSEGWAMKCGRGGDVDWTRRYASPDQEAQLEQDPQMGPIPQDGFSFTLPAVDGDGYLLVGWTYYDNTAVYVGRLVRIDSAGQVQWQRSFTDLEDASAYSYLADGIRTDDGYLLCGMESPGIMLGGGGWLVSVTDDGSVNWHRRYPATDRDLEQTGRRDVFTSITRVDDTLVLSGYYDPDDDSIGTGTRAWTVGLDDSADIRWDDRFELEVDGPTHAYDVATSDSDAYEFLVVGAAGPSVRLGDRDHSHPYEPGIEGDGFVAAYTADGERMWLQGRDDTPMFTAERGPQGVVCGGSRGGHGWVGTLGRTDFEADGECAVTSLCEGHGGELVASGRRISSDRTEGWARLLADLETEGESDSETDREADATEETEEQSSQETGDDTADGDSTDSDGSNDDEGSEDATDGEDDTTERSIEFVDCQTVRVVGDFEDVILGVVFRAGDGQPGTIQEPVGGVDGEQTIHGPSAFDLGTDAAVVTYAEGFDETPGTPGLGTVSTENPTRKECEQEQLGDLVGGDGGDEVADGGTIEFLDCETARVTGTFADVIVHLSWWTEDGLIGTIEEPVGGVDGERTIDATEEFGPFEYGPILNSVELFDETPSTPGLGVQSAQNPNAGACENDIMADLEADGGGTQSNGSESGTGVSEDDTGGGSGQAGGSQTEAESETEVETGTGTETQTEAATAESTDGQADAESDEDGGQVQEQTAGQGSETERESDSTPAQTADDSTEPESESTPTEDQPNTSDGEPATDD